MPEQRPHPAAGYLLIEALIALAIVAVMASLLFTTRLQTSQAALLVGDRRQAVLLARSVMAAATVESSIAPISERGNEGPFDWSVTRSSFGGSSAVRLQQVVVTITRRSDGRQLARLAGVEASR